jgi:CBS domain containing-hemolysin-like protein
MTWLELGSVVLIIAWNAFFVAAEYAFVTVRRTRLQELVAQGSQRARAVVRIIDDPTRFISAMQLGITFSSLALGAVGVPAFERLVRSSLGPVVGGAERGLAVTLSVLTAFAVISALHVVLGEIVPKTVGLNRAEATALWLAGPVRVFFRLAHPFIWLLQSLARAVNRTFGLQEPSGMALVHSEDELKMLVSASKEEGVLEAEEQEMLYNVFGFSETDVVDVMVPRPDIVALPVALSPAEAMEEVLKHPYTRYPVYGDDLDDLRGLLHLRRLVDALRNGGAQAADLGGVIRPAHVVPETKKLGTLLGEFRRTSTHMAVVVDEYGSTSGLVTLEDLIEEIVGEIDDEFDEPDVAILRLAKDRVRVAGAYPIEEFNERFGLEIGHDDYVTVGGFVFGELGRAPVPGDSVDVRGCRLTVHDVDGPRIVSVEAHLRADTAPVEVAGGDEGRRP